MSVTLQNISGFAAQTLLTGGAVIFAFWKYLGPKLLDKWMDGNFSKKLEKYKHDLGVEKESLKHALQKQILQYQNSIEKKSEIYQALFEKLMRADGAVDQCRKFGLTYGYSYDNWDVDNFRKAMESHDATNKQLQNVIGLLEGNREAGEIKFKEEMDFLKGMRGKDGIRDARNYFWIQKIYISTLVAESVNELISKLEMKHLDHEYPQGVDAAKYNEREKELRRLIGDLENQMRVEMLGKGD